MVASASQPDPCDHKTGIDNSTLHVVGWLLTLLRLNSRSMHELQLQKSRNNMHVCETFFVAQLVTLWLVSSRREPPTHKHKYKPYN